MGALRNSKRRMGSFVQVALLALASSAHGQAPAPAHATEIERDGVAVAFSIVPAATESATSALVEQSTARVRFTITDTTSGKPLTGLHPAAWLSRQTMHPGQVGPQTAAEKVQELLGGSIFAKADVDLNTFRVLALNDDATVSVVDPLFGFGGTKLLALVPLPGLGNDWRLGPDSRLLYVTATDVGKLSVIDTATWTVTTTLSPCRHPGRLALQPDAHYLWVACDDDDDAAAGVAVVAADPPALKAQIDTGRGPHDIVFSADSRWAFVSNAAAGTLSVIDVHTLTIADTLKLDGQPTRLAYSPLSGSIYVADAVNGTMTVVDGATHEIVARIDAEPGMAEMQFAPGDRHGFITVPNENRVLILDAVVNRIIHRASIDGAPEQVAFSGDMAFVRRQHSASVGMIPLKEIGRAGQSVPVAEFTGGDRAFGARRALASSMIAAPGENAVIVANPLDKAVYFYMEGMAAPMGTFGNYDREPRAVLVLDRSLREVTPGVYESSTVLPPADTYDVLFFLAAPRIVHAFATRIEADPAKARAPRSGTVQLTPLATPKLVAGQPAQIRFRLNAVDTTKPVPSVPDDLLVRAVLAPGTWHQQKGVTQRDDGTLEFTFTPPNAGLYYFYASSATMDEALSNLPCLVVRSSESTTP